jgi:glycosyltransferase involved in cell wall biosynthesis
LRQGSPQARTDPVGVVRIIARLNIGGPAIQAITLTRRLEERRYRTTLVRGLEEPDEGNMDNLADQLGVRAELVATLRRNPSWRDLPALLSLVRILRRERPEIVHTHAAKGGTLGRVATLCAFPRRATRPILVHTYHGHSLTGYFSPRTAGVYRWIEQVLARSTDRLVAVSQEVRDDLVTLRVAPASKFEVVPLGFDLAPFTVNGAARAQMRERLRAELGIPPDARVVTLVARLVPIKRVDRFLRVANGLRDLADVRFLIVGDGELRTQLQHAPEAASLGDRVIWAGFRRDMPAVCFASNLVVQTSDNEGTPVSLIEAQAAGVPVVSTRVGGTESVIGEATQLASVDDEMALADAARSLLIDSGLAAQAGAAGRERVLRNYDVERLVSDIDALYRSQLASRAATLARRDAASDTGDSGTHAGKRPPS